MSSLISVEEPQVLLPLPKSLHPSTSDAPAAPAYRLQKGRKLLRSELVVGVHGECVNVYNVRFFRFWRCSWILTVAIDQ